LTKHHPIVHVVDDDESCRRALERLLSASGFEVRTHASGDAFLAQWDPEAPGCVVADLEMPGLGGLDLQAHLARTGRPLPILFLTGHADIASTVRAMREGAEDFLEKTASGQELIAAVRRALARNSVEREERARQAALHAAFSKLTEREREVLAHVVHGRLNKQTAGELGIHERTVKLHRTAIMAKLQVRSVAELTLLAQQAGLLSPLELHNP
jgi:FixJ family two-component response regulator